MGFEAASTSVTRRAREYWHVGLQIYSTVKGRESALPESLSSKSRFQAALGFAPASVRQHLSTKHSTEPKHCVFIVSLHYELLAKPCSELMFTCNLTPAALLQFYSTESIQVIPIRRMRDLDSRNRHDCSTGSLPSLIAVWREAISPTRRHL
jgi:hypothetical protein